MAVKIYKTGSPPPLINGPVGYMQYTYIVTAGTKDEAAELIHMRPSDLTWEKDLSWHAIQALLDTGLLRSSGEVYLTSATRDDHAAVWRRMSDEKSWELLGRWEYRGPGWNNPYLKSEA